MNTQLFNTSYREALSKQIESIDVDSIKNWETGSTIRVVEEQKIYFWIRLYLKDDNINAQIGDDITIRYTPSGEELKTKFICYDKKGLDKDFEDQVTSYNSEDNKKVMCLMIDTKMVNLNDDIPFVRTLFKTGYHYEYQLIKREELQFVCDRNGIILEYFDVDF